MPSAILSNVKNRFPSLSAAVFLIFACGCGGSGGGGDKDLVKGRVTLNGQAVAGQVIFVAADKKEYPTVIALNGDYQLTKLPKGEYSVLVKSGMGSAPGAPAMGGADKIKSDKMGKNLVLETKKDESGGAEPPAKYSQLGGGNDLKVTVTGGDQKYDIVLTP